MRVIIITITIVVMTDAVNKKVCEMRACKASTLSKCLVCSNHNNINIMNDCAL